MIMHSRNNSGTKTWKLFSNHPKTSPTSTLRDHFKREHPGVWESECCRLNVPRKGVTGQVLGWNGEPFTREGLMVRLQKFIVGDDQVRLQSFLIFSHWPHRMT